ncbi:MAG: hypothetical protein Kow0069_35370 [Promethearchaeota archaeon]
MLERFDRTEFREPPSEFRPFPFWFLNDDLDGGELVRSLEEFARDGRYGGVVVHPRTGMEVEYLSDEFFDRMRLVVETCAKLGLFVYLYDEYNWPSGVVGGRLLREDRSFGSATWRTSWSQTPAGWSGGSVPTRSYCARSE